MLGDGSPVLLRCWRLTHKEKARKKARKNRVQQVLLDAGDGSPQPRWCMGDGSPWLGMEIV